MSVELPMVTSVVSRMADDEPNLAALSSLVYPLALLIEAPIIMKRLFIAALILSACATPSGPVRPYTLTTCIVSDNKLGSMGDPITKVHDGQEIKFCAGRASRSSKPTRRPS